MASVTRKSRPARPRREATEAAVFDAVERLLADGARYTELGVQEISDAAGIGRSTFYVHFADKTDLLIRLIRASTADLFGAAERWLESGGQGGYELLEEAIVEVCRQRRAHAPAIDAVSEVATYDPVMGEFWREQVDGFAGRLAKKLAAEKRSGRVASELDPQSTASFLTWGVERALGQQVATASQRTDARVARAVARSIWLTAYGRADDAT